MSAFDVYWNGLGGVVARAYESCTEGVDPSCVDLIETRAKTTTIATMIMIIKTKPMPLRSRPTLDTVLHRKNAEPTRGIKASPNNPRRHFGWKPYTEGVANSPLALQAIKYIPENPAFLQIVIFHDISSNSQDTTSGLWARGVGFEPMK